MIPVSIDSGLVHLWAQLLECSYQIFQRKHARQIECIQLYDNGPRLFLESDVVKYKEGLAA
jgi:hypothetical protein